MTFNFNNNNFNNVQIGDKNVMFINEQLTDSDWENIIKIFNQKLNEVEKDSDAYKFLEESHKHFSIKNETALKNYVKLHSKEFLKNVFYNITSSLFISALSKIGIIL